MEEDPLLQALNISAVDFKFQCFTARIDAKEKITIRQLYRELCVFEEVEPEPPSPAVKRCDDQVAKVLKRGTSQSGFAFSRPFLR